MNLAEANASGHVARLRARASTHPDRQLSVRSVSVRASGGAGRPHRSAPSRWPGNPLELEARALARWRTSAVGMRPSTSAMARRRRQRRAIL